jgi:hypothetical protein
MKLGILSDLPFEPDPSYRSVHHGEDAILSAGDISSWHTRELAEQFRDMVRMASGAMRSETLNGRAPDCWGNVPVALAEAESVAGFLFPVGRLAARGRGAIEKYTVYYDRYMTDGYVGISGTPAHVTAVCSQDTEITDASDTDECRTAR